MVNAVLYSIYGQFDQRMEALMDLPAVSQWQNDLLDALVSPKLEAILAFAAAARRVVQAWPGVATFKSQGRVFHLTHGKTGVRRLGGLERQTRQDHRHGHPRPGWDK